MEYQQANNLIEELMTQLFSAREHIDGKYEVLFPIHQTTYGESYRVKSLEDGKLYMLKLYAKDKLKGFHFNEEGDFT